MFTTAAGFGITTRFLGFSDISAIYIATALTFSSIGESLIGAIKALRKRFIIIDYNPDKVTELAGRVMSADTGMPMTWSS